MNYDNLNKEKYILYGASFNPPHIGHFSAISQMLEIYDKVVVFPYPRKNGSDSEEFFPPIKQRFKMLEIFIGEFFPQMTDRLILIDLATDIGLKNKNTEGILHTYDYLQYIQKNIPNNAELSVCLGFEAQNLLRKEYFYKQEEIEKNFGVFRLQEENSIKSKDLRDFFSNHKNVKTAKDELYIRNIVGHHLAEYIFQNNLYGLSKPNKAPIKKRLKM